MTPSAKDVATGGDVPTAGAVCKAESYKRPRRQAPRRPTVETKTVITSTHDDAIRLRRHAWRNAHGGSGVPLCGSTSQKRTATTKRAARDRPLCLLSLIKSPLSDGPAPDEPALDSASLPTSPLSKAPACQRARPLKRPPADEPVLDSARLPTSPLSKADRKSTRLNSS